MQTVVANNTITKTEYASTRRGKRVVFLLLAFVVALGVFWWLKLVGITMAGEAFCGFDEHVHTEECLSEGCTKQEHTHIETCYSNIEADLESQEDWDASVAGAKLTGVLADDIVAIAESQLGYTESTLNYILDASGNRAGYNRYGAWHGNPYGNWSSMFAAFCMHYANIDENLAPYNSGSDAMRLEWEAGGLYSVAEDRSPLKGDLVFLDKDANGNADAVAVIKAVDGEGISVIEGDLDNTVAEAVYKFSDASVMGYGVMTQIERKTVDADELERIDYVISAIDALPTGAEAWDELALLEDDVDAYEARLGEIMKSYSIANLIYSEIPENYRHLVTNYSKLESLMQDVSVPSTYYVPVDKTGRYTLYEINELAWVGFRYSTLIIGKTIDAYLDAAYANNTSATWIEQLDFNSWICYQVEFNSTSGMYYVAKIHGVGVNKRTLSNTTSIGYMLLVHPEYTDAGGRVMGVPIIEKISIGDSVVYYSAAGVEQAAFPTWGMASTASTNYAVDAGIGYLDFGTKAKESHIDNTPYIHGGITTPNTTSFIDINLYDYGGTVGGANINSLWAADQAAGSAYPRPGFQRPAVLTPTMFSSPPERYDLGFGDMVVSDFDMADFTIAGSAGNPAGINKLYTGYAAIRATEGAMYPLLKNGSPALVNGTDLGYLFKDGSQTGLSYIEKQNTQNVTGLFQYDPDKQLYYFNSRETHAQWDAATNTFKLYDEEITPNFIMYPFGNFMPFTNLATDTTPLSPQTYVNSNGVTNTSDYVNVNYIKRTVASAWALYNSTGLETYRNLALVMEEMYASLSSTSSFLSGYESAGVLPYQLLKYYSDKVTSTTDASYQLYEKTLAKNGFDQMYSIDFDEESNFFFGMDIHFDFVQPVGGVVGADKDDMTFNFTGDDDVWVYLDGVLFLDLSGIHSHVGGTINFKEGKVYYYCLKDFTGDIQTTPYKTVTFAEILASVGRDPGVLVNGTFAENSVHTLDFYYMERGSGSSMCSINFNLTAMPKNHIEITKEINVDSVIGDPDYYFQIVEYVEGATDTDSNPLLIKEGAEYGVYDSETLAFIESRVVQANGIIRIKAGETAMGSVPLGTEFFVRELFDQSYDDQYKSASFQIPPSASKYTVNADIVVGGVHYIAVESDHAHAGVVTGTETPPVNLAASSYGTVYAGGGQSSYNAGSSYYNETGGVTWSTDHVGKLNNGVINTIITANGTNESIEVSPTSSFASASGWMNIYFTLPSAKEIGAVNVFSTMRANAAYRGYPDQIQVYVGYEKQYQTATLLGSVTKDQFTQYNSSQYVRKYTVTGTPVTGKIVIVRLYIGSVVQGTTNTSGAIVTASGSGVLVLNEVQIYGTSNTVEREDTTIIDVENVVDESKYSALEIRKNLTDYSGAARDFTFDLSFDGVPVPVGTVYDIYNYNAATGTYVDSGTDGRVTTAGEVVFSSVQSVRFNNILANTVVNLSEVESGIYDVTYSYSYIRDGTVVTDISPFSDTDGVVSGSFAVSTDHIVTVNNIANPTRVHLPIGKTLVGATEGEYTYNVMIQQVADALGTPLVNGFLLNKAIVVNADNGYAVNEVVTLVYSASDGLGDTFFKVYEENNHLPGYDNNYYIFKVTLTQSAVGRITATTELVKYSADGTSQGAVTEATFANILVGTLSVSKVVEGVDDTTGSFDFTVRVTNGITPITGTYTCTDTNGIITSVEFVDGVATISLTHGQTVQIQNLPLGATWTVTEAVANGYQTAYQVNGSETRTNGRTVNGEVTNASGVTFYNVGGYELPATNGSLLRRVMPYIGILVMLVAFGGACIIRYKRKGAANN